PSRFLGYDTVGEGAEARRVAAAAGLPAARPAGGARLLSMEEVRLTTPEAGAGGGAQAGPARAAPGARGVVGGALREGLAWRLRLDVPAWGATVPWRGHERELGGAP